MHWFRSRPLAMWLALGLVAIAGLTVWLVGQRNASRQAENDVLNQYSQRMSQCVASGKAGCGGAIYNACMADPYWGNDTSRASDLCQAPARIGTP